MNQKLNFQAFKNLYQTRYNQKMSMNIRRSIFLKNLTLMKIMITNKGSSF